MSDYETLGVSPNISDEELHKAYKNLLLKWHPDNHVGHEQEATEQCQKISQAYNNIQEQRKQHTETSSSTTQKTNYDIKQQINDLEERLEKIKQEKKSIRLQHIHLEHNIRDLEKERNDFKISIHDSLESLISEVKNYYVFEKDKSKHRLVNKFSNKKRTEELTEIELEETTVRNYLDEIRNFIITNQDKSFFELTIPMNEDIKKILIYIHQIKFDILMDCILKYHEKYQELADKIHISEQEKKPLENRIADLDMLRDSIQKDLNQLKNKPYEYNYSFSDFFDDMNTDFFTRKRNR